MEVRHEFDAPLGPLLCCFTSMISERSAGNCHLGKGCGCMGIGGRRVKLGNILQEALGVDGGHWICIKLLEKSSRPFPFINRAFQPHGSQSHHRSCYLSPQLSSRPVSVLVILYADVHARTGGPLCIMADDPTVTYDDASSALKYSGTWSSSTWNDGLQNATMHVTTDLTASVSFVRLFFCPYNIADQQRRNSQVSPPCPGARAVHVPY